VLRIRNVYPRSGIFPILDPGSNKKRGGKVNFFETEISSSLTKAQLEGKFHKVLDDCVFLTGRYRLSIFNRYRKIFESIDTDLKYF